MINPGYKNPGFFVGLNTRRMKILCRTLFDCSHTGTTGRFNAGKLPYNDNVGNPIDDQDSWNYSRNQQRNWETLNQLISLRTQPYDVQVVPADQDTWQFEFEVEHVDVYGSDNDLSVLLNECNGVPMIVELGEKLTRSATLITTGSNQNIWFEPINK